MTVDLSALTGDALFIWWRDALLVSALLIAAVLMLRRPVAHWFGAQVAYALWLLPVLRWMVPPVTGDPMPPAPVAALSGGGSVMMLAIDPVTPLVDPAAWPMLLFTTWAAGAVAVLVAATVRHRRAWRLLAAGAVSLAPAGRVRILLAAGTDGPLAIGLLRPAILLPRDFFARYAAAERAAALAHELAHHRRGDLWANVAALIMLASQWFNPLAWAAWRAFRLDQELACDARVLADAALAPATYARAVAKSAIGPGYLLSAPMNDDCNLKGRLMMMNRAPASRRRALAGLSLMIGTGTAALALSATVLPARAVASDSANQPPVTPAASAAPAVPAEPRVILIEPSGDDRSADAADAKPAVRRIIVERVDKREPGDAAAGTAMPRIHMMRVADAEPTADDLAATLRAAGIDEAKARDAAARLVAEREARRERARIHIARAVGPGAPMPPLPPMPPMPAIPALSGLSALPGCAPGEARIVTPEAGSPRVRMLMCGGKGDRSAEIAAMKRARDRFAAPDEKRIGLSAEARARVVADLDRAIAALEAKGE